MAWLRVSSLLVACLLVGSVVGLRAGPVHAAGPPPVHHPLKLGPAAPRPYSPTGLPAQQFSSPSQGYIPCDLANAYGLRNLPEQGQGITIGIPDAYDQPNLEADLHQFDVTFGLPDPTLNVIRQGPFNGSDQGWQLETSLDVEYAHALAPKARIVVVLAPDADRLWDSLPVLVQNGADLVSMSWGTGEFSGEGSFTPPPGPFYAAASGDAGPGTSWPAVLPQVASVGGTAVSSAATGHDTSGHTSCTNNGQPVTSATQTAWSGSGGGVSTEVNQPSYQQGVASAYSQTRRVQNDTALDADPSTGVTVYDTAGFNQGVCDGGTGHYSGCTGFLPFAVGGTSLATPLLAASVAVLDEYRVAHGMAKLSGPADLYALRNANANDFSDVGAGNNGGCGFVCNARSAYDSVTGFGSPSVAVMEGGPATCAKGGNQLAAFGGTDSLGGAATSPVAAASWDDASRKDIFVRGSDGALWHAFTDGGAYSGWEYLGGALAGGTGPAVAAWSPGRLDMFVVGLDHQLWHKYWSSGWSGWEALGGYVTASPTVASWGPDRLDIFVRGYGNGLWHRIWANRWYGYEPFGGTLASAPAASSWSTNHLEIFAHGGSGIQELVWTGSAWSGWNQFAATPQGDPAAGSCAPGRVAAVDLDQAGALRYLEYAGAWSSWNALGLNASGPGLTAASGNLDLYTTTPSGAVQHVQVGAR
jgi:hypothetical protein